MHQLFVNGALDLHATTGERVLVAPQHGLVWNEGSGKLAYFAMANYAGMDTFTLGTGYGAGTPTRRVQVEMVEHPLADPGDDGASTAELMGGDLLMLPGTSQAMSLNGRFILHADQTQGNLNLHDRHLGTSTVVSLNAFGDARTAYSADISDGGRYVVYGSDQGACVWDRKDDVRVYLRGVKGKPVQTPGGVRISGNGRYVVFSTSDDVFDNPKGAAVIGLWDVQTGQLTNLTKDATMASTEADISKDARYVVFQSYAQLEPTDTNKYTDVYLLDRTENKLTRILNNGEEWKSGGANLPRIAPSGKTVVFGGFITLPQGTRRRSFYYDVATGSLTPITSKQTLYTWTALSHLEIGSVSISADDKWMTFAVMGSTENGSRLCRMNLATTDGELLFAGNGGITDQTADGRYAMFPRENSNTFRVLRFATP